MHYTIDDNLLSRLKAIAAADAANADVVEALLAAEADPLIGGLFWKRSALLHECRRLLTPRNANNPDDGEYDPKLPLNSAAREDLAQYLAGEPELCLPGVIDEVANEMAMLPLEWITHEVESTANRERIPKRTIKALLADDYRITCAVGNLSDEAICGGILACAKAILDELVAAFAADTTTFRRATKPGKKYRGYGDIEDFDDW